ncbi:MAG: hypothetical protein ACJ8AH_10345 [Stellaceae bacterium]
MRIPRRRFRGRASAIGTGLIPKRGDVFLRPLTREAVPPSCSDAALGPPWFAAAFPEQPAVRGGRQAEAGVRR